MKDFEQSYYESLETRSKLEKVIESTRNKIKELHNRYYKNINKELFTSIMYELDTYIENQTKIANTQE